ncbi:CS1 type fimbrial major subunit [Pantoea ananatis]
MNVKAISAATLIMASSFVAQADQVQFNVEATIPNNNFFVTGTGWEATTQKMIWNELNKSLTPLRNHLKMKNTGGGIKVYLADNALLTARNSLDIIPLTVKVLNKPLKVGAAESVEILNQSEAGTERTVQMEVSQTTPFKDRPAGDDYTGTVTMIFENAPSNTTTL